MSGVTELRCAVCLAPRLAGDRFCENCGAAFSEDEGPHDACAGCGGTDTIGADGYCTVCGARAPSAHDRVERDSGLVAAISDRGRVSRRNEDAFALAAAGDGFAAVVCDGISSASAGDVAARQAALAAGGMLTQALEEHAADLGEAIVSAVAEAQRAVVRVPWTTRTDRETPSCTLVSALCRGPEIVVASVGDSRAYWLGADGARQLSVDDSWAQEQIDEGRMSQEQAHRDPRSHTITHWIGQDAPLRPPRMATLTDPGPGRIVLCTDGLWNYLTGPSELAELIAALPAGSSPAAIARALTETALTRGGRDNITVAVIELL
jgi:serine/threonine protein phosphatase PrpC